MSRALLKAAVEHLIVGSGAPALARRRRARRGDLLVLAYHNVVPDGAATGGDASLHLPLSSFRAQLDALARTHRVVPLADALRDDAATGGSRPRAAITFDDAYESALALALPELAARGMPATLFVTPDFVGGRTFWWDDCAAAVRADETLRSRALTEWSGDDATVRANVAGAPAPAVMRCATPERLAAAAAQPGIDIGAHTWSHPHLPSVPAARLVHELHEPLEWLRARFTNVVPLVSYPYGGYAPDVERATEAAGYDAGFRVDGGWSRRGGPRFAVPRLNVPAGLSLAGFLLRTSGLLSS